MVGDGWQIVRPSKIKKIKIKSGKQKKRKDNKHYKKRYSSTRYRMHEIAWCEWNSHNRAKESTESMNSHQKTQK